MSMRPDDPNFPANQPPEECLDDDTFRLTKHQRLSSLVASPVTSQHSFNLINEPKPLGLKLKKSASLLEMIHMRLSGATNVSPAAPAPVEDAIRLSGATNVSPAAPAPVEDAIVKNKTDAKETRKASSERTRSYKAMIFNAIYLRIGSWEFKSMFDGDLVAKSYFSKKTLVWEVIECGKKLKMEMLCNDIIGLKGNYPNGSLGNMIIMLARPPLFYIESAPQPRRYTVWQPCSDFTNGQASLNRTHVLQFKAGVLRKHFERLLGSDPRLNMLSQQPQLPVDSPFAPIFNSFELSNAQVSPVSSLRDRASSSFSMDSSSPTSGLDANILEGNSSASQSASQIGGLRRSESMDLINEYSIDIPIFKTQDCVELPNGAASPILSFSDRVSDFLAMDGSNSGMDANTFEGNSYTNQNIGGFHHSVSMTDLMSEIGQHVSAGVISGLIPSEKAGECEDTLKSIAETLLSDTPSIAESDERVMSRVNSLCCLLQQNPTTAPPPNDARGGVGGPNDAGAGAGAGGAGQEIHPNYNHLDNLQPPGGMPRIDSLEDFFLSLPHISSFSDFLSGIGEDGGKK